MKTKTNYIQCKLQKNNVFKTVWIPSKFAIVNKYLNIKGDDSWKVIKIFDTISNDDAIDMKNFYKTHREGSDI